jgi:hypothetical protein
VNTLNQLAKSIHFATKASELEFDEKISQIQSSVLGYTVIPLAAVSVAVLLFSVIKWRNGRAEPSKKKD